MGQELTEPKKEILRPRYGGLRMTRREAAAGMNPVILRELRRPKNLLPTCWPERPTGSVGGHCERPHGSTSLTVPELVEGRERGNLSSRDRVVLPVRGLLAMTISSTVRLLVDYRDPAGGPTTRFSLEAGEKR